MLRARRCARLVIGGLAMGMSLLAVGCGGGTNDDPVAILIDFQKDNAAATKKYQGKTVRLSVEKVTTASKQSVKGLEHVTVQGRVGNIIIDATVTDPAEQQKALALKIGDPATFEGEPGMGIGELRGAGALFLKDAKVVGH
jgi:hypothetical protein